MISEKLNAKDCTGWFHLDFSRKGKPAVTRSSCSQWDEKQELTTGRQEDVLGTQKCSFTGLQGHNTALWQVKAPQNVLTRKLHTRNTYFNRAVWVSTTCEETSRALPQWGNATRLHYGMATEARLENQPRCTQKTAGNDSTQLSRKNGSFHKSLFFCCIPQPSPLTTFLIPAETLLYVNQTPFPLPGQRSECAIFSFKLYVATRGPQGDSLYQLHLPFLPASAYFWPWACNLRGEDHTFLLHLSETPSCFSAPLHTFQLISAYFNKSLTSFPKHLNWLRASVVCHQQSL